MLSSAITQRLNMVTGFNVTDGDKNPWSISYPLLHAVNEMQLTCSGTIVFNYTSVRSNIKVTQLKVDTWIHKRL